MRRAGFYLIFTFSMIFGGFFHAVGNEPPGKILDASFFNTANQKQIVKANSLIEKGNKIWQEAEDLRGTIELLKTEFRFGKANKLEKKRDRLLLHAAGYYRDAHKKQFNALEQELESAIREKDSNEAREVLMNGKGLYKKARRVRLKAENLISETNKVEMFYEAVDLESQALSKMENVFSRSGASSMAAFADSVDLVDTIAIEQFSIPEEKVIPVEQPALAEATNEPEGEILTPVAVIPAPEPLAAATIVAAVPVVVPETEPEPIAETQPEVPQKVFFSVQILADRKEVPTAAIDKVYSGNLSVIHVEGDGWHRYMVGRFKSVTEAREAMTGEGLKGFIVAYNGDERITVQEAVELMKNNP